MLLQPCRPALSELQPPLASQSPHECACSVRSTCKAAGAADSAWLASLPVLVPSELFSPFATAAGEPLPTLELGAVRGLAGIKEASVRLPVNATTAKGGCAGKEVRTVGWCGEGMDT